MATVTGTPKLELEITLKISEGELQALNALVGYGNDAFIKTFYEKLGKVYMREHEGHMRSFMDGIRKQAPAILHNVEAARKAYRNN